ncbi:methylated-DNA--[protein]-cysteine S-methyltransferase [Actinocrinis puniceicyclus]|uniref:methylated-DNA--[protein]-cysteine S-methyltransferase n=1 Tax=Actinocrinis puniceicyclus TaxID=977794 RepID=A0A8J7WN29_9ACTN|nr:methylated-DNA--[protein]-cysteine S-methyltransferase [Actinocrinis puniceicyclus]MBS2962864.1 methylated-DNA--[protein]-cysteine S-methyltransferase [Actinocrinis puniceicyclus]
MADLTAHRCATPLGPFTVLARGDVVHASGFTDSVEQLARLADSDPGSVAVSADDHGALAAVRKYFEGELAALDVVETRERPAAAPFRTAARQALRRIPAGATATYTELAASAGNPRAVRAAGSACATNPTALFVPCHRVVRANGSLGGFLYGLDVKRALLDHEAKHA